MSSDIKHWRLNAKVYDDRVEEVHFISDPARNIRRKEQTRVWQVERLLGRGSFGEVRLEKNKEDGQVRAVKRIAMISDTSNNECEKELKALLEFSKQKYKEAAVFVEFLGWFRHGNNMYLAMEFVHLGDLEKNVVAQSGKLPENECRDVAEQILSGLEIMHAESFAHRDLKPQNVLVISGPPQWWVKLADFGVSKRLTDSTVYNTRAGTQSYMAPEILEFLESDKSDLEYTNAVDIWSVGCIVYRLISGVVPFPNGRSLVNYCNDKSLFPLDALFDSGIKSAGYRFIRRLLVPYPNNRPSATQALQDSWIHSGSSILITSSELSYRPASKEKLGISNQIFSKINYGTDSHGGLQSLKSLPSESQDVGLPSSPSLERSHPSSEITIRLYPTPTASIHAKSSGLQNLPKDWESREAKPTKETPATTSGPEILAKPRPTSSQSIDNPLSLLAADEISKKKRISFSRELSASVLEKETLSCYMKLEGHTKGVDGVAFSPDGKLVASSSEDETIRLWDTATGAVLYTLEGQANCSCGVAFSPDGKLVASASKNYNVQLWDVSTGAVHLTLKGHRSWVTDVAFSPSGQLMASVSCDRTIQLWDTAKGAMQHIIQGHTDDVFSVAFSPDGNIVASTSRDGTMQLYDTIELAITLKCHTAGVDSVAFSPDGKLVASSSRDKTLRLWDRATGAIRYKLKGHTHWVHGLAFSPDGRIVASASSDSTVRLWEAATGTACCMLTDHTDAVWGVAFSRDGRLLASASNDKTVRLWAKV